MSAINDIVYKMPVDSHPLAIARAIRRACKNYNSIDKVLRRRMLCKAFAIREKNLKRRNDLLSKFEDKHGG